MFTRNQRKRIPCGPSAVCEEEICFRPVGQDGPWVHCGRSTAHAQVWKDEMAIAGSNTGSLVSVAYEGFVQARELRKYAFVLPPISHLHILTIQYRDLIGHG